MSEENSLDQQGYLSPIFSPNFLADHARRMLGDPKTALVELVANCWDAGANTVKITWPTESIPDLVKIEDDGTGMTRTEFEQRWRQLSYNRRDIQGEDVVFPTGNQSSHRKAFGRNGKGRHSAFCFASRYSVITWCNGEANEFEICRTPNDQQLPYGTVHKKTFEQLGHGTIIRMTLGRNYISVDVAQDLIGSKFVADPTFTVSMNGSPVELSTLEHLIDSQEIAVQDIGTVTISQVDTQATSKSSRLHGIAWWVNRRLVGDLSWEDYKNVYPLDRRKVEARRYTFVVIADVLSGDEIEDWSGFRDTERYKKVRDEVYANIHKRINLLMSDDFRKSKRMAFEEHRDQLAKLSSTSRRYIGDVISGVQDTVQVADNVLSATVGVLVNLEQSRSGYALLEKLSQLNPDELDELDKILNEWSVQDALLVLDEIDRRLKLIERLEIITEDPTSDELHQIHPLIERGLWIFGPEYESIHFASNRSLLTVIRSLFDDTTEIKLNNSRRRPDIVVLPDSTLGLYACDGYDQAGNAVDHYGKILIIELKRGGSSIGLDECLQGQRYAAELRKSGKVQKTSLITVFVLGTNVLDEVQDDNKQGNTMVCARSYSLMLRMAQARTFYLQEKIKSAREEVELFDADAEEIVAPRTLFELPIEQAG